MKTGTLMDNWTNWSKKQVESLSGKAVAHTRRSFLLSNCELWKEGVNFWHTALLLYADTFSQIKFTLLYLFKLVLGPHAFSSTCLSSISVFPYFLLCAVGIRLVMLCQCDYVYCARTCCSIMQPGRCEGHSQFVGQRLDPCCLLCLTVRETP